jgi:hypothetical protein
MPGGRGTHRHADRDLYGHLDDRGSYRFHAGFISPACLIPPCQKSRQNRILARRLAKHEHFLAKNESKTT